mgnify:CR=1 FL=1
MILNLLSISIFILIVLIVVLILCNQGIFSSSSNFRNLPTIEEQKIENEEFLVAYDKFKKKQEEQEKNQVPYTWNLNNTLESMKLEPCLANDENSDRMSCYTAGAWWYPNDAYKAENFRSIYYGD